jgi:hypothetical protein
MKFFRDLMTGIDGTTYDLARVMGGIGAIPLIVGGFVAIWRNSFDPTQYGTGFGLVMTALGAALVLKRQTEPQTKVTSISDDAQTVVESKS